MDDEYLKRCEEFAQMFEGAKDKELLARKKLEDAIQKRKKSKFEYMDAIKKMPKTLIA